MPTAPHSILAMIREKRLGGAHSPGALAWLVDSVKAGTIPDYQLSAWLMAVVCRGMTLEETTELTRLVAHSGEVLDLSAVPGPCVDKHSTGGVGDKVTLVLAPLVASAGATVAKLSGRGLGHTGGTIDKMESIPHMRTSFSDEEFLALLKEHRVAVAGQTKDMAPVDGSLYALRDVTGTVESIPLIAMSVLSKKIAAGAEVILLDVKAGRGAFMADEEGAAELARTMMEVGKRLGKKVICVVSGMDQPLGHEVGNANEVQEAIATLRGEGPADLSDLCVKLGAYLLAAGGVDPSVEAAAARLRELLRNGKALAKFREMVVAQGGDPSVIDDPSLLPKAGREIPLQAERGGWVEDLDAYAVSQAALELGGGRKVKGEAIDHAVGVRLLKKLGDRVEAGETLALLRVNSDKGLPEAMRQMRAAYRLGDSPVAKPALFKAVMLPESLAGLAGVAG